MAVRPRTALFPFCLLVFASNSFSLFGSLRPSSQVSRAALCLLSYDGRGRVYRGPPDVLVSSSLSPWRHELQVMLRMRRLSVLRLEADMRQEAASLALLV